MAFLEFHLRSVLANDSSAISTLRCLKLYLERLGCNHLDTGTMQAVAGCAFQLVHLRALTPMCSNAWATDAQRLAAEVRKPVPAAEVLHRKRGQAVCGEVVSGGGRPWLRGMRVDPLCLGQVSRQCLRGLRGSWRVPR